MCVHVFGNSPSPAVATYGLRRTAENSENVFGVDVKEFVQRNFYVDDGLTSLPTSAQAIDLMKRTQRALKVEGNLRLHKIASNSDEVMNAFPSDDLAKDLKDLDPSEEILPLQRSLGLTWDLKSDSFRFQVSSEEKPYTRRGILSTVNSLFDPVGFVAPVTIQGKFFLRNLISGTTDWDEVLPVEHQAEWEDWRDSLQLLEHVKIPRTYLSMSLSAAVKKELHIFSDASEKAIAAVAYLKTTAANGSQQVGFVLGKAKVAPMHGHTIPRLELCAAVLAVEMFDTISDHLDIIMDSVQFYTDSKVVLGYIHNQTRRFYVYVSNRVERIRKSTRPEQWTYISTDLNPADYATRSIPAARIQDSPWVLGPSHLLRKDEESFDDTFPLLNADEDKELRPKVDILKMIVSKKFSLGSHRFERFSSWKSLVETYAGPIVPVSSDPESPVVLSPSMLLTQKIDFITEPFGPFEMKDLYKAQWKRVQTLADIFWNRWRREYLQTLQNRRKWQIDRTNIKQGDIVLLKDNTVCRNEWPVGVVVNSIPSGDDRVRKAEVRVIREGKPTIYTRPITEMILLLTEESTVK